MDVWYLGCTISERRLVQRLFDVFLLTNSRKEDYVDEIASFPGKPPEPWAEYFEPDDESDTAR
ncbi:hypothetical protein LZ30DRAFT_705511 [Colletotrichum cereale]|nr:hypothetical protein LZ30DRAFT_705511 [Colletotrichum cereale]